MLSLACSRVFATSCRTHLRGSLYLRRGMTLPEAVRGSEHDKFMQDSPFPGLGMNAELYREVGGGKKFRQHVNPLKKALATPPPPPDWAATYANPSLPLVVDIGAGYGRFLLGLARVTESSPSNHLGFEIREAVVDRAKEWALALGLRPNVHFVLANATLALEAVVAGYPGHLDLVTIQFPDPQFKRRHRKRRIVQPHLVDAIAKVLPSGGRVFLQSDVLELAEDMRDHFAAHPGFVPAAQHQEEGAVFHAKTLRLPAADGATQEENSHSHDDTEAHVDKARFAQIGWLLQNPLPMPTEREVLTQKQGGEVYRVFLVRQ